MYNVEGYVNSVESVVLLLSLLVTIFVTLYFASKEKRAINVKGVGGEN